MAFNVSYVFQARNQFSAVAKKVKESAAAVKTKMVSLGTAVRKLGPKFDRLKAKLKGFGTSLRDIGGRATLFATVPIALIGRSLIKAASDAEETRAKFNTVFRDISVQSNKVASDLAKNFGLSGTGARELLGDTGDLLTGFGFTQKSALQLSKQVNELAVDLASFTNFSGGAKGASQALTKALLGERESIKSLGISILEEDVKARVKQLVLVDKMKFATLRQAKAFATLQLAQEQSKNAIGDFARTSAGFANQQRIFSARIQDLSEKMGNILLPTANKLIGVFIRLAERFTNVNPAIQKMILIVGGVVAVIGPLLLLIGGLVSILPIIATGFGFLGTAIGVMLSPIALAVAAIAALGFVVFKNFDAIKASISSSIGFVVEKFNVLVSTFKTSDIGQSLIRVVPPIVNMWKSVFRFFGAVFSGIGILASMAWESVSSGASTAFSFVTEKFINPMMTAFQPIADSLSGIFSSAADFIGGVFDSIAGKISPFIDGIGSIAGFIGSVFDIATDKVDKLVNAQKKINIDIKAPNVVAGLNRKQAESKANVSDIIRKAETQTLKLIAANGSLTSQTQASADVNINVRAPKGVVESVKTNRKGSPKAMNLGVNMAEAG